MEFNTDRLQKYGYDEYTVVTNFGSYADAIEYAEDNDGELIEVGFTDGSDNPMPSDFGNLIENKRTFLVDLPHHDNYEILYSDTEGFQDWAKEVQSLQKKLDNDVAPEDWLSDQNIAPGDRLIIIENGELNTVTTRERIKFLMRGDLYELAVKIPSEA